MKRYNTPIAVPKLLTPVEFASSDYVQIYAKSDGKIYKQDENGTETEVTPVDYMTFDTIADLQTFAYKREGIKAYIKDEKTEYRVTGTGANDYEYVSADVNRDSTTANVDFWVNATTGSDATGDGSELNPWASLEWALQNIPSVVTGGNIDIFFSAGTYNVTDKALDILGQWIIHKNVKLWGSLGLVREDFTASALSADGNPYRRDVVGATFTENQYAGYCARLDNYDPTFSYCPLGPHGTTDLTNIWSPGGWWCGGIYSYDTIFVFDSNRTPDLFGSQKLVFNDCQVSPGLTTKNLDFEVISNCTLSFSNVRLNTPTNKSIIVSGNVEFSDVIVYAAMTTNPAMQVNRTTQLGLTSVFFYNTNPSTSADAALLFSNTTGYVSRVYTYGFAYGWSFDGNVEISTRYGHYPCLFENVGVAYYLGRSGAQMYLGEEYGEHKVYLYDTNYLWSMGGALQGLQFAFDATHLVGTVEEDFFVPASGGLWQGTADALYAERDKPDRLQDAKRAVSFYAPALYPEREHISTTVFADAGSDSIDVGT
jgi:hypothetical protein